MNKKIIFLAQAGIIAALYVVLTWISALFGLSSGVIQVRISEALCVLPLFTPAAIPGLTVGCLLANLLTGSVPLDIAFGSLATLSGAVAAWLIGKAANIKNLTALKLLVPFPNIVANMLVVPWVLKLVYCVPDAIWFIVLTVGAGEVIASAVIGIPLMLVLDKNKKRLFIQ